MLSKFSVDELLVLGDLNLNCLSDASVQFKNLMCSRNLSQLIIEPTRPNPKDFSKSTLLDLIFTNKADKYPTSGVFELGVSDHCPIACIRDVRVKKTNLTPPDGMISVCSAFPSGIVPLESLWEGAKLLVADWINHLPMLVIDGPNQTIRSAKRMT